MLGILAAGAAQGAANASNMNVQAQNQVEMQNMQHGRDLERDALREEFLNKRFDKEVAIGRENAKAAGALRDQEYRRNRADKLVDDEAKHKQAITLEGFKDKRSAASNATRLQAAALRSKGAEGGSGSSITLPNGEVFTPNDADSKAAANLVRLGLAADLQEGYQKVHALRLSGNAASSIQGLTEGTIPAAMKMSGELLNGQQKQQDVLKEWNPKTGKFE
jgi:hypothetical protein